ncbi:MAG: 2Fe-2S iron-sulfur cluster-binding protein [Pseudomonadota bacterium]
MANVTFITFDGEELQVAADNGSTLMETALRSMVPGIDGDCGGACVCATCHVYVTEPWQEKVGEPSEMEEDMLDFAYEVQKGSRLACQIKISDTMDGLVVQVPERQG